jgi:outer membrane protein assembly factor BamB
MHDGSIRRLWLSALVCPAWGLVRLWRHPALSRGQKLLWTAGLGLYSILYAGAVLGVLVLAGLKVEFRGGRMPALTFRKTVPDYEALEASRARQRQTTQPAPGSLQGGIYWTGFRGPRRDGHYDEQRILTRWPPSGPRLLWRQPAGGGYASFAVAEGRAFTIEQRRHQEVVVAYAVDSGQELWTVGWEGEFRETLGGDGPRATPQWDEGRVYALGALGEFRCLEAASGRLLWRRNVLADAQAANLTYGLAASPLVVQDKVIVAAGDRGPNSLLAYDKRTGQPLWQALDEGATYSSPMWVQLAGRAQLLVATVRHVVGVDVDTGQVLWRFPWSVQGNNRNIAQPLILSTNRFFLSAGYGTGCVAVEINQADGGFRLRPLWRNRFMRNKFTSSVLWQGYIYGLDEDVLACLEAETGRLQWRAGRYGYGQVLLASGHLLVLCGDGDLALVEARPDRHLELARVPALRGKTWNHPAMADGRLLVRNNAQMACFDLRARP